MLDEEGPPPDSELVPAARAKKPLPWGRVPGYLINLGLLEGLSLKAAKLLIAICIHGTNEHGKVWVRMTTLIKETGLSEDSIYLGKKELKAKGIIHFDWAPKYGTGHWIWLAHKKPGEFSNNCNRFRAAKELK